MNRAARVGAMVILVVIVSWIATAVGLVVVGFGVETLARRRIGLPWLRARVTRWRPYGWAGVWIGLFALIQNTPRAVGASATVVFACSGVALLPLLAGVVCLMRSRAGEQR